MRCTLLVRAALPFIAAWHAGAYIVSGTVVAGVERRPLNKVLLQLNTVETGTRKTSAEQYAMTGDDGRFAFQNVAEGKYRLRAARPGDTPQSYLQDGQYSTAVIVKDGLDTGSLVFPYVNGGSLEGAVTDESGEPLAQCNISLFGEFPQNGQLTLQPRGFTHSAGRGRFHFNNLAPGRYLLAVYAQRWNGAFGLRRGALQLREASDADLVYPVTYYPGTSDYTQATPIVITEGAMSQIQIAMRAVSAVHPQLMPEHHTETEGHQGRGATLVPLGPGGPNMRMMGSFINDLGPAQGVAPGRYRLVLNGEDGPESARIVDVHDNSPIDPKVSPKVRVSGQITINAGNRPLDQTSIFMVSNSNRFFTHPDGNGRFDFNNRALLPGHYSIEVGDGGDPPMALQSLTAKGAGFSNGDLELADGATIDLRLTATIGGAAVHGFVMRNDQPVAGAAVLLLPARPNSPFLIRKDQSDSDGSFNLLNVVPGEYRVIALEHGEGLLYRDENAVKPYLSEAKLLRVNGSEITDLRVAVQASEAKSTTN